MLVGYHNPDYLKIESRGNEYPGQIVYQIGAFGCPVGFFAEFLYCELPIKLTLDKQKWRISYIFSKKREKNEELINSHKITAKYAVNGLK